MKKKNLYNLRHGI